MSERITAFTPAARPASRKESIMVPLLERCLRFFRPPLPLRRDPLVLINGLAEQPESWYCNHRYWDRYFDVKMPEFLVYGGERLHHRIEEGLPISVDYLTDQLDLYLDGFVQQPAYHLVASSLGCQVAVEYAVRFPERVRRMVLLCPSGFGGEERLPVVEGVRRNDFQSLVSSVFHNPRHARPEIVEHYARQFADKHWKKAVLRTIRGTADHSVRDKLPLIHCPVLVICGTEDRITDPHQAEEAVRELPNFRYLPIRRCGHAPQIEHARRLNRMVVDYLSEPIPKFAESLPPLVVQRA